MKEFLRRGTAFAVILALCFTLMAAFATTEAQAASKTHLKKTSVALTVGETYNLKLLTASNKIISASKVTWKSTNKKIATVSSKGKITAKSEGTVTIKATYKGKTYKCKVKVTKGTSGNTCKGKNVISKGTSGNTYALKETSAIIELDEIYQLKLMNSSGKEVKRSKVTWTSKNKQVATVTSKGLVKGVGVGKTKIIAKYKGAEFSFTIEVGEIQLLHPNMIMSPGDVEMQSLIGCNDEKIISGKVTWVSTNTNVVSVFGGKVTAIAKGNAVVRAIYKGKVYECPVEVRDYRLNTGAVNMYIGDRMNLTLYNGIGEVINPNTVAWSSSNSSVVRVNAGVLIGEKEGNAVVTANYKGQSIKVNVTISNRIHVNNTYVSLDVQKNPQQIIYVTCVDNSPINIALIYGGNIANVRWEDNKQYGSKTLYFTAVREGNAVYRVSSSNYPNGYQDISVTVKDEGKNNNTEQQGSGVNPGKDPNENNTQITPTTFEEEINQERARHLKVVEDYKTIYDTKNSSNEKIIDNMKKQLGVSYFYSSSYYAEKAAPLIKEVENKSKEIAYLRQDTSGANQVKIKRLEEEVAAKQDEIVSYLTLQKTAERVEMLEKEIEENNRQKELVLYNEENVHFENVKEICSRYGVSNPEQYL